MNKEDIKKITQEQKEKLKAEMLSCLFCNPHTPHSDSPEFFDQWRIKHYFHPKKDLT